MNAQQFISLFEKLEGMSKVDFEYQLAQILDPNSQYFEALVSSFDGNTNKINRWLFSLPANYQDVIAWIAPLTTQHGISHVWMVGYLDSSAQSIYKLFDSVWSKLKGHDLLNCPKQPPYLRYLKPIAIADWKIVAEVVNQKGIEVSDVAIFQVPYEGDETLEDIDQLMPMNADSMVNQAKVTFSTMKQFCTPELISLYEETVLSDIGFYTKLHTESHNIGHFVGSWPYSKAGKDNPDYEAIEEYRACLAGIGITSKLEISQDQLQSFSLHVVCTRIFGYGYRSATKPRHIITKQDVREATVGALFFETLKQSQALSLIDGLVTINPRKALATNIAELQKLHSHEAKLFPQGKEVLRVLAEDYYAVAYPACKFSYELGAIYTV